MKKIKFGPLLLWTLGTLAVGAISGIITMGAMEEYAGIDKPALSPPSWLFPIVWSILFILMGISAYIVWDKGAHEPEQRRSALFVYFLQLAVNFIWPILFFNLGQYFIAFLWLLLLIALVVLMIVRFAHISPAAAWLNAPYLAWLCFAGYLNLAVWILNK